jgi:hypothetical protein
VGAVAFAAERPRRELGVAGSTVRALLGNQVAPGRLWGAQTRFRVQIVAMGACRAARLLENGNRLATAAYI